MASLLSGLPLRLFRRKAEQQRKQHRKQRTQQRTQQHVAEKASRRFQCVEVVPSAGLIDSRTLCDAYNAQQGKRYLANDAPALPLAGCDRESCHCRYRHYGDRREDERRNAFGMKNRVPGQTADERRMLLDRRNR